jgi:ParB family transcriptional regulator, chromosome partitioning protein
MNNPSDPIRFSVPLRPAGGSAKRLGKGLGALLGESRREEPLIPGNPASAAENSIISNASASTGVANLSVSSIEPLPGQPRRHFDEAALDELAASIAARGVIQPVIVRPLGNGRYQLVVGERRWRASQRARLHEIPALIRELDDRDAMALIENIQREDLNPVEEARAYQRLSQDESLTQAEIARLVDKSRSHVANLQRLLALPTEVLDLVEQNALSMGHARALVGHARALELVCEAVARKLSVRDVEALAKAGEGVSKGARRARRSRDPAKDADIAAVQGHLEEFLGLPVQIKTDADPRSGAVTIRYRSLDQLDLICQRLTGGDI